MNYTQIAVSAVEALLSPIKEGREPTDAEWGFAEQQLDAVKTGAQAA